MSQLTMVVKRSRLLEDHEIYDITPVAKLSDLLLDEQALCIAYEGEFINGGYMMGQFETLRGFLNATDGTTTPARVLFAQNAAARQSCAKNRLDRIFSGEYLFASWKANSVRTFKICKQGKTLAEYPAFDEAIAALIPGKFQPNGIYSRKYNYIEMMGLEARARRHQKELFSSLYNMLNAKIRKNVLNTFPITPEAGKNLCIGAPHGQPIHLLNTYPFGHFVQFGSDCPMYCDDYPADGSCQRCKDRWDHYFRYPYLFCSWHIWQKHTYKIVLRGKVLSVHEDFADAISALLRIRIDT